jgi:surfactin family lipopeptide synthetase C
MVKQCGLGGFRRGATAEPFRAYALTLTKFYIKINLTFKVMNKENIADIYELSPLQQGILFHSICEPETGVYFIQLCYRLQGNLNLFAFEKAWEQVVNKHTILRTAFYWEKLEKPLQVVYKQVPVKIQFEDWSNEGENKLETWLVKDREKSFNLSQAPLMRWNLISRAENDYYFVWSKHHLILDGWSTALVLKEVVEIYESLCQDKSFSLTDIVSYREYIAWLQQQDLTQAKKFWQTQLQGIKTTTSLGIGRQGDGETGRPGEISRKLSFETTKQLQSLAKENQLTLNTLVQGAWALLLNRYSSETDIVYGVTVSGRPTELMGAESMVGLFINTLPVRINIKAEASLLPWLKQLQSQLLEIRQYEYSPLVEIQGWSEVPRDLPLFESIVVFENYPVDSTLQQQGSLTIESVTAFDHTNYPLTVTVIPGEELSISIAYTTSRFDAATVNRMLGHFQTLLLGMVNNSQTKLVDLPLLTAAEQTQLLEFNQNSSIVPEDKLQQCIHQLFEAQAIKTPDAVAVVWGDSQLTYQELNSKADRLAYYLEQNGVKPEIIVGIYGDRSVEMVIALLAILKAGGAYLPLDTNLPHEAITFRLQDAQVPIVLTQKHLQNKIETCIAATENNIQIINLDLTFFPTPRLSGRKPCAPTPTNPDNLAYVIYTSGSTGKPKGVMVNHASLVNAYWAWEAAYQLSSVKNHLQMANFAFDVFTGDLVRALCSGGKLVLCPRDLLLEADKLYQLIQQQQIDCGEFVPVVLRNLMGYLEQTQQKLDMSLVICGSDSWYGREYNHFRKFLGKQTRLINSFGVTEATIDSCYFETTTDIASEQLVPIGKPFANTQLYILDEQKRSLPIGVTGELYIGGVGVARGYLNRLELTVRAFRVCVCKAVVDLAAEGITPLQDGKLYKTGDKARYLPNGNIEFLGRIDNQVKLRGFRIELGEIEGILSQHSLVKENVVIIREDNPGEQKLVAYLVLLANKPLPLTELRNFLREKLPEYSLPSAFVFLEKLPVSPNGKIDRKSLPIPKETCNLINNYTPPCNAIEEILAGIWARILHLQRVGIHDNFFDLGGHSLLATQVISRIREAFAIELPIRCLFESPSVAQLAKTLIEKETKPGITKKRAQILQKLENMSPEEAKRLLKQKKALSKST